VGDTSGGFANYERPGRTDCMSCLLLSDPAAPPSGNPYVDGMLSTLAHEIAETATDPWVGNAPPDGSGNGSPNWVDEAYNEVGDFCAWVIGSHQYDAAGHVRPAPASVSRSDSPHETPPGSADLCVVRLSVCLSIHPSVSALCRHVASLVPLVCASVCPSNRACPSVAESFRAGEVDTPNKTACALLVSVTDPMAWSAAQSLPRGVQVYNVVFGDGSKYLIQTIWSPQQKACVTSPGGAPQGWPYERPPPSPPSPPSPRSPAPKPPKPRSPPRPRHALRTCMRQ
jgi:hypothetical protein